MPIWDGGPTTRAILSDPEHRREHLGEGWTDVAKVFVLAFVIDVVYQIIKQRWVYPDEALIVAIMLALVPYLLIRGSVRELHAAWFGGRERHGTEWRSRRRRHAAHSRPHEASVQRTLMAWVRTAVSMITFGFTIYKFFDLSSRTDPWQEIMLGPHEFALIIIAIGLVALLLSTAQHGRACVRCAPSSAGLCQGPSPRSWRASSRFWGCWR